MQIVTICVKCQILFARKNKKNFDPAYKVLKANSYSLSVMKGKVGDWYVLPTKNGVHLLDVCLVDTLW